MSVVQGLTGADHKKKQRKLMQHIIVCIGDSAELEYTIRANDIDYKRKANLNSGDVFFIDQKAIGFGYRISNVRPSSKPQELCVRDGTFVVMFDKN